jgi:phenylacetate-CoA ligase
MKLGAKIRKALLSREIERRLQEYTKPYSDEEALEVQLTLFNECWRKMAREIPFYHDLQRERGIPETIASWEEFLELFPVMRRQDLNKKRTAMASVARKPDFMRITSGTTSVPVQMPAWSSELSFTRPDRWMARTWYGIQPDDRGFYIWGNPPAMGARVKGMQDHPRTFLYDRAVGDYRLPSYDFSEDKMRECGQRLLRHRPGYVLAYSMALDALARANAHLRDEFRSLSIKAVVGGSEGFPSRDRMRLVGEVFGCPVAMEYGSYETGLMAHTRPQGTYVVFWRNCFLEAGDEGPDGARIVRVTSLYERCFPLVRYEIGDEIELMEEGGEYGLRSFQAVVGRTNSFVLLGDGAQIHTRAVGHCVRDIAGVVAFQIVQGSDNLTLSLVFEGDLPGQVEQIIRSRLGNVHPLLADVRIRVVETLLQSAAGKTPVIIDEPEPGA